MHLGVLASLLACADGASKGEETGTPAVEDSGAGADDRDPSEEDSAEVDPHPLGMSALPFSLLDINPNSATAGQLVSDADLIDRPFALIFLDSRCLTCVEVADDLWADYAANAGWWDALPTFAIQSAAASERAPQTIEPQVANNALPYLQDTESVALWSGYSAYNHDFFAFDANHDLDTWLDLYVWPDDLATWEAYMTSKVGG